MAEFSKQWCEINDPEMPSDFDIMEEYHKLKPGNYIPYICEGFGFTAIGKLDDECMLAIPVDNAPYGTVIWKSYNEIVKAMDDLNCYYSDLPSVKSYGGNDNNNTQ